jgi:F-type H+-transporting ATPase subunit a
MATETDPQQHTAVVQAESTSPAHGDAAREHVQAEAEHAEAEQDAAGRDAALHSDTAHGEHDPLSPEALIGHVKDADYFHVPRAFTSDKSGHVPIPQVREETTPIVQIKTGIDAIDQTFAFEPLDLKITKYMVLEVVAALILVAIFVPLARKVRSGQPPRGRFWNMLEVMVVFIRDQVARPTIGSHDGDRFAPFLLTLFFFVLTCNLLGLVPWAGSPTGALATTGALAMITFGTVLVAGSLKMGLIGFWKAQVPTMQVPLVIGVVLKPMIFVIEVLGLCIKHFVLAMRLLANMMAGHVVLAVLVAFIAIGARIGWLAFFGIAPASMFGAVALSLLELFVAFLQAYIFAFLAGLFIGMAVHPH